MPGKRPTTTRTATVPTTEAEQSVPHTLERHSLSRLGAVGSRADPGPVGVLRYLIDQGVLATADVVRATPLAEDVSVSHRSYRISVDGKPRWFVKRSDPARSGGRDLSVEAAFYRLTGFHRSLAGVVPACRLIGDGDEVLVLDALAGMPLSSAIQRPPSATPTEPAASLHAYGRAVAQAHEVRPAPFGQRPWLLSALEPGWGRYAWLPPPCAALLMRLAGSRSCRAGFSAARREWRESCLVHGDIRWANAFVAFAGDGVQAWLVDWELACVGDPAWDVGSLLADIVATTALGHAGATPDDVWPWCSHVLAGYRERANLEAGPWRELLRRSVRLAAVRLVQALVEHGHGSGDTLPSAEAALMPWVASWLAGAPAIGAALAEDTEQLRPAREERSA